MRPHNYFEFIFVINAGPVGTELSPGCCPGCPSDQVTKIFFFQFTAFIEEKLKKAQ
jgi:hypothetical protein